MATYTSLDDVKRILRSSDKEVVRFSDSLTQIRIKPVNSSHEIGFNGDLVQVNSGFDKKLQLTFKFTSDTEFNAYYEHMLKNEVVLISDNNLISEEFTTPDGMIVIPSGCWVGSMEDGDKILLTFDPHMSNDDANRYIQDAEVEVDSILAANQIRFFKEVDSGESLFEDQNGQDRPVPPSVSVATAYLAAYYIYTDAFLTVVKDGGADSTYAGRWKKRAEGYLQNFMEAEGYSPPLAIAFPKFIDKFGVPGEGPGMGGMSSDLEEVERDAQTENIERRQFDNTGWHDGWIW